MARFGSKRSKRFRVSTRVFYGAKGNRIGLVTPGIPHKKARRGASKDVLPKMVKP